MVLEREGNTTEYALNTIAEMLIFCDAESRQLEYIRRFYMERWQKEQEADVHRMIEEARLHINESGFAKEEDWIPNMVWLRWVERYICNRFQYMLRWEWVEAFAMMDDETLLVRPKGEQAAKYLIFTRNYARKYLSERS